MDHQLIFLEGHFKNSESFHSQSNLNIIYVYPKKVKAKMKYIQINKKIIYLIHYKK